MSAHTVGKPGLLRERGVTLVELMVSLVIGLLLVVGATSVYLQSRSTYHTNDITARLQEVGRYAIEVLEPDVRLAGYWGLINDSALIVGATAESASQTAIDASVASNCGNNWTVDLAQYIDGRDGADSGGSGYDLSCAAPGAVSWADVLIVRHASPNTATLENTRLQIQTGRSSGALFTNGTMPGGFGVNSETHNVEVNAYYINRVAGSPDSFPRWELRRRVLNLGPAVEDEPVIPGVQDLQVQFGVDTNNDQNADQYFEPETVPAGTRVVSARIWLLVVSDEHEPEYTNDATFAYANIDHGSFDDTRRRLLVTKTIQLRNATL